MRQAALKLLKQARQLSNVQKHWQGYCSCLQGQGTWWHKAAQLARAQKQPGDIPARPLGRQGQNTGSSELVPREV